MLDDPIGNRMILVMVICTVVIVAAGVLFEWLIKYITHVETLDECKRRLEREWQREEKQRITTKNREQEQRRRKEQQQRADAWNEAERFYEAHKAILSETLPPAFFRSHIRSRMPEGIPPADAWTAARDIIAELTPLVREARERQREKERQKQSRLERLRAIDREIAACNAAIARLRRSRMEPDVIEDEILGQQRRIRELNEQRELIANASE